MKKLILSIAFLFASSVHAFAGTISIQPFISGNDVTIAHLESQRTTISNVINGNIEGGVNIKAGSLVSQDFSNSVSPVTRWDESFTDFTYSGMLPPTSANLTSTTTAGISYVDGYRVSIGSTANTYTASKDTYVYVHSGGYYVYQEVGNGGTAPSTPANTLLLAKVVTSGSAVTSVSDLRTLGIGFGTTTGIVPVDYRKEMFVSQESASTLSVGVGVLEVNGTRISKTSATTLTLSTAGDWAGGSSLQAVSTYGYVGVDVSGNIKMHTTAPTHSDYAVAVTAGVKRYATWSNVVYRIIGWFYMNSTGSGELFQYEVGNLKDGNVPNEVVNSTLTDITLNDTSYGTDMDATTFHFYSTGRPVEMKFAGAATAADVNDLLLVWDIDGSDKLTAETRTRYATTGGDKNSPPMVFYKEKISQGTHTLKVQGQVGTSTLTITNWFASISEG